MSETKTAEDTLLEANKELNQARYERGRHSPGLDKFEMLIHAMNPKIRLVLRA